ncbi:alpha-galactosidase [Rathayibacter sp. VKM Ac-2929]|uniref:alpha-galactosidase n=1 Tax=Rathayibacter sp. VKM Ac-2929 TaxID=2929480 RepID=UPI001FB51768|nr:alpha-galactosidase [Rathayibacter sp. VKM Ac-2929]MCJ1675350.1 alpha-galactosidase [Rathayibacter sp. VKM Ac-2929]
MGSSDSTARHTAAGSVEVRARRVDGTSVGFRAVLVATGDGRLVVADSTPVPTGWRFTGAADELLEVGLPARPGLRDVSVVYTTTLDTLDHVDVPDTGRWHMNSSHPVSAWRFSGDLQVRANSLKTPVYVFERLGGGASGVGVIAAPTEMDITLHEPASNRALNVHFRRLRVEFTLLHLADTAEAGADGEAVHRFWIAVLPASQHADWRSVLRRFSACERLALDVRYPTRPEALEPYWCTGVDWSSEHVTQELVLRNARLAAELGIPNIVIDDGWFGRGRDSSDDVPMDIGDWTRSGQVPGPAVADRVDPRARQPGDHLVRPARRRSRLRGLRAGRRPPRPGRARRPDPEPGDVLLAVLPQRARPAGHGRRRAGPLPAPPLRRRHVRPLRRAAVRGVRVPRARA